MSFLSYFAPCAIVQASTGSLSFLASSTIAFMVSKKREDGRGGLTSPYRRLVFGLSISDAFQSFSMATGPWSPPPGVSVAPWGAGNHFTCSANGVFLTLGMSAAPLYVCFLSFYYLCKLKRQMTDDTFTFKYEKKMHIFIVAFHVILVMVALMLDAFRSVTTGTFCHFAAMPYGCRQHPEIYGECIPEIAFHVQNLIILCAIFIPFLSLAGIISSMGQLYFNVIKRERIFQAAPRSRTGQNITEVRDAGLPKKVRTKENSNAEATAVERGSSTLSDSFKKDNRNYIKNKEQLTGAQSESSVSQKSNSTPVNRPRKSSVRWIDEEGLAQQTQRAKEKEIQATELATLYRKETVLQALLYVGSFCLTFFPTWLYIIVTLSGAVPSKPFKATIELLTASVYTSQGMLNILVYTRPKVASLRRKYPECSRIVALYLVVKEGGEVPEADIDPSYLSLFSRRPTFSCKSENASDKSLSAAKNSNIVTSPSRSPAASASSISAMPFGVISGKTDTSLKMQSLQGVDGRSGSLKEGDVAHRPEARWEHQQNTSKKIAVSGGGLSNTNRREGNHESGVSYDKGGESGVSFANNEFDSSVFVDNDTNYELDDQTSFDSRLQSNSSINMSDLPTTSFSRPESDVEGTFPRGSSDFESRELHKSKEKDDDAWSQALSRVKKYSFFEKTSKGSETPKANDRYEDDDDIWGVAFARVKEYEA